MAGAAVCAVIFAALAASVALQRPALPTGASPDASPAADASPASTWTSEQPARKSSPLARQRPAPGARPPTAPSGPLAHAATTWSAPRSWQARVEAAAGQELGGAAIASVSGGPVASAGPWTQDAAWSAIKMPLLAAYIAETGPLAGADRALARRLIVDSDNGAANTLFLRLGDPSAGREAVQRVLRRGGDSRTTVDASAPDGHRTFTWLGQTRWSVADGTGAYRALAAGALAGPAVTRELLGLLGDASAAAMPWGLRAVVPAGTPLAHKVGVGTNPDGTVTVEQFGIVGSEPGACAVGVMARGPSEPAAKAAATRVARAAVAPALDGGCAPAP